MLCDRLSRLYDLADNKTTKVVDLHSLGRGINGGAWKWCRRLFA